MDNSESGLPRFDRRILTAYYATLALLTAGGFLDSGRVWGFNWWSYFPVWVWLPISIIFALAPFVIPRLLPTATPPQSPARIWSWSLAGVAGCLLIFRLFSNETHFLGDGIQILHNLQATSATHMFWNIPAEWIQAQVFGLTGGKTETDAKLAIQLISYASGAVTIVVLLWAGRRFGLNQMDTWLLCLGLITSGIGMFFFGYIETYPPFICAMTLTCLLGVLAIEGKFNRSWAVAACLLAITLHLFAMTLLPAVAYLILRPTSFWKRFLRLPALVRYGFLVILMAMGIGTVGYLAMHDYQISFMLVPLFADRFTVDGYTLFSPAHLLDLINLLLLLIPAVALVVAGVSGKLKTLLSSPASRFLLIAALGGAGLVVVFDPKLGMLRDWDLFAFASIPILILWSLLCLGPGRIAGLGRALAVLTIILNLAVLVPRIAVAMSTERSLRMVEQIFKLERAKSKNLHFLTVDYLRSHGYKLRGDSLAKTIFTRYPEINLHERAVALFDQGRARESIALDSQALAINPSFYDPYTSMCAAYGALNQLDKALEVGEIVFGLNPRHPGIAYNLANITARLARVDESKRYLEIALNLDSAYQPALYGMASIAVARGDGKELQRWLVLLPVQDTVDSLKFADLVSSACLRDMFDLAADMLRFGLEHRLDTAVVLDFVRRYPQIQIREK